MKTALKIVFIIVAVLVAARASGDNGGYVLFAAFFGWLIWLAVRSYLRSQAKPPQSGSGKRGRAATFDGDDDDLGGLEIAKTPEFINERAAALAAPPVYMLEYIDADGVMTQRGVTPSSWPGNAERTHMWCHMRQNWRTFRYDRMHKIVRVETGEILEPDALYAEIMALSKQAERAAAAERRSRRIKPNPKP